MDKLTCGLTTDLAGKSTGTIHLIPAGKVYGRDKRGPYTLDASAVLSAFADWGMPVAVDYDHQGINTRLNGQPAPAAGWIYALDFKPESGLWGNVEWTDKAAQMIAGNEYRYMSPVFDHDQQGNIVRLTGAALTNSPNLNLEAITACLAGSAHSSPGNSVFVPNTAPSILVADAAIRSGLIRQDHLNCAIKFHSVDPEGFEQFLVACCNYQDAKLRAGF